MDLMDIQWGDMNWIHYRLWYSQCYAFRFSCQKLSCVLLWFTLQEDCGVPYYWCNIRWNIWVHHCLRYDMGWFQLEIKFQMVSMSYLLFWLHREGIVTHIDFDCNWVWMEYYGIYCVHFISIIKMFKQPTQVVSEVRWETIHKFFLNISGPEQSN